MNWDDYFYYEDGKLYWKVRSDVPAWWNTKYAGREAGCYDSGCTYFRLTLNKASYLCHRIIWEMHNGKIPDGMDIDHIDRVRTNNMIENLRVASRSSNCKNQKKRKNNTSGFTGVSWHKASGKWAAYVSISSGMLVLGYFNCIDDAIKARKEAESCYGYHEGHGV